MHRRSLPVLLLIPLLAAVAPDRASACSCAPPPPPKQALEGSAAVFTGKVTAIERHEMQNHVTFELDRSWKGPRTRTITVRTPLDSAACGFHFEAQKAYIVYCHARADGAEGKPGVLETNLCTRTALLANAKGDLDALGKGRPPQGDEKAGTAGGREIKFGLTVPSTAHRLCIREVHRVGDELWVLSEVRMEGIGGAAISRTEATAKVDAPADMSLKHFVLGKDWNWSMEKYEYPASKQAFDELVEQQKGERIATFECFAKPEPQPLGPPPKGPEPDPRPEPDPARPGE